MFNPSDALSYGPSRTLNSTTTTHTISNALSSTLTSHKASNTSYASNWTIAHSSYTATSRAPTTIVSATSGSGVSSTASAPAQVSVAAAHANYAGFMGTVAGGVFAGLALIR
jgi:predicted lipid-binding transport protein (Tim44 family)